MTKEDRINLVAGGLIGITIATPFIVTYCLSDDFQRAKMMQSAQDLINEVEKAHIRAAQPFAVTLMQMLDTPPAQQIEA